MATLVAHGPSAVRRVAPKALFGDGAARTAPGTIAGQRDRDVFALPGLPTTGGLRLCPGPPHRAGACGVYAGSACSCLPCRAKTRLPSVATSQAW